MTKGYLKNEKECWVTDNLGFSAGLEYDWPLNGGVEEATEGFLLPVTGHWGTRNSVGKANNRKDTEVMLYCPTVLNSWMIPTRRYKRLLDILRTDLSISHVLRDYGGEWKQWAGKRKKEIDDLQRITGSLSPLPYHRLSIDRVEVFEANVLDRQRVDLEGSEEKEIP